YGLFEYGAEVPAGQTTVLPFVVWMTPLDKQHEVKIPSPTTEEVVITNPNLPGLELHIPPRTVITDHFGKIVTKISITPIPLSGPPFPLPAVEVPIYFTIQPGGAYLAVSNSSGAKGARLIYPNTYKEPAGTVFEFWNYDADVRGWYVYGGGK